MKSAQMNVIVGLDEYRKCVEEVPLKGKWQAWLDTYYSKYRAVFDKILSFLYMSELDTMRPYIEAWDFQKGLETAERFVALGGVERVKELLSASARVLDFQEEYDVYLLVWIGQVGGTALPAEKPFLFIGMERWADNIDDLSFVLPHEFLHMKRGRDVAPIPQTLTAPTFGQFVVEEGLATVFSIAANELPLDTHSFRKALGPAGMTDQGFDYCEDNRDALTREILEKTALPMAPELANKYLYSGAVQDERGMPGNAGYYVGARIVLDLLEKGLSIKDLVRLSAVEILSRWGTAAG